MLFFDSGGVKYARLDLGEAKYARSIWARPGTPDLSMCSQRGGEGVPLVRWLCAGPRSDVLSPSLSPSAMSH